MTLNEALGVITAEIVTLENEDFQEAWIALGIIVASLGKRRPDLPLDKSTDKVQTIYDLPDIRTR